MTLSTEAIALALVFLLPGFIANRLSSYFSTAPPKKIGAFDAALASLGVSVLVLAFEAALAGVALAVLWSTSKDAFDSLQLDILTNQGLASYFQARPLLVAVSVGAAVLFAMVTAVLIGLIDPVDRLLRRRLDARGLSPNNPWSWALREVKSSSGKRHAYAMVTMRGSRDVFRGAIRSFSLSERDDGGRDFVLEDVTYIPGGQFAQGFTVSASPPSLALLNSSDVESIVLVFTD